MTEQAGGILSAIAAVSCSLTQRRIRANALILAVCLWGVCAVDYATPGIFDRAGNVKFQDFLQFPVSARLIAEGHSSQLYDDAVLASQIHAIVGGNNIRLQYFYGPQVALPFIPLLQFPFLTQAVIWMALSLLIYFTCVYLLWKSCAALNPYPGLVVTCAIAYPPLFHFFVRGQLSAAVLLCFTAAWLAFRARYDWLAGIALGFLVFKPQFIGALFLVLLLARSWNALAGLILSAASQLGFVFIYFGPAVTRAYSRMLLHSASQPATTELSLSLIQMHSLRAFWALLLLWPGAVWVFYTLSSFAVIGISAAIWKSSLSLGLRFSALVLASVLVNPHIYIYDLVALIPVLLLLVDWMLSNPQHPSVPALCLLSYLAFVLPLFGPLSRWTHLQLSVIVFAAILWFIYRDPRLNTTTVMLSEAGK